MEFNRLPDEYNLLPEEDHLAPEIAAPAPEYPAMTPELPPEPDEVPTPLFPKEEEAEQAAGRKKNVLRKLFQSMQAPVAATIAAAGLILAAANLDPIGNDVLGETPGEESVFVASPTPTPTPTPTPEPAPSLLKFPEGSVPGATDKVMTVMHAANEPDYIFESSLCESEEEALAEVKAWLKTWGGNPRMLPETSRTREFLGYDVTEAIIAGSTDSPDRMEILGGTVYAVYRQDIYCDAYLRSHSEGYYEFGDDGFPVLTKLDPDFNGEHTYTGIPEQFIRIVLPEESGRVRRYLEMGEAWTNPENDPIAVKSDVPGAVYDRETNVLTLTNCNLESLDVNLMGNGFTIELVGENHIGFISIWGYFYGGSVTFTGDGTLSVNEDRKFDIGLELLAEYSYSALMVKPHVELEIYGGSLAVYISSTKFEHAIYFLKDHTLLGGGVRESEEELADDGNTYYYVTVVTPDDKGADFVTFEALD